MVPYSMLWPLGMVMNILGVTTTTCSSSRQKQTQISKCSRVSRAPHLGGHRPAPVGLQRLQLLLHHLEQVLHLLDFTAVTVLCRLHLRLALIQFLL
jgi:hypothetical protein